MVSHAHEIDPIKCQICKGKGWMIDPTTHHKHISFSDYKDMTIEQTQDKFNVKVVACPHCDGRGVITEGKRRLW